MASSTTQSKVDAVVQKAAASAPGQLSGVQLYSRFAIAGAICCSVTHGALTPVDVYVPVLERPVRRMSRRAAPRTSTAARRVPDSIGR
jgi:hypothetical protein